MTIRSEVLRVMKEADRPLFAVEVQRLLPQFDRWSVSAMLSWLATRGEISKTDAPNPSRRGRRVYW
jgi:hypothetical protein